MGVIRAHPATVCYLRGLGYEGEGNEHAALADFSRAITFWPQWPVPYDARARIYERLGETAKAQADREETAQRAKVQDVDEPASAHWTQVPHYVV